MVIKSLGAAKEAKQMCYDFMNSFGRHEVAIERYFDHAFFCSYLNSILKKRPKFIFEI